ncbi:MAG: class I adenylate-forming enzyme family protein [Myxococcota bacterium]
MASPNAGDDERAQDETSPLQTVPGWLRRLAREHGERTAVVLGDRRLSYAEAESRSATLARGLLARGAGKGTRVALLMPNGPDWVVAWLAAARIGAISVPFNTFYQTRELGWVLEHSDAQWLLTVDRFLSHDYLERLEQAAPSLAAQTGAPLRIREWPYLREIRVWGDVRRGWASDGPSGLEAAAAADPSIDDAFLRAAEDRVSPADPLIQIYSSGSTADPKGAIHAHGSVLRHSARLNAFRDMRRDDRLYSPMPFFWVGGFVFSLLSVLHEGACLLCEEAFEPGRTLDLIERERATLVAGWPHYAKAMAEHESFGSRDLSSLRGGNLYDVLPDGVRPRDPALRATGLGMTETCGPHTLERMDHDLPEKLRGSFGRPVPGVEHKVVDPATGQPLPPGSEGEICVRGDSLMLGLYKVERADTFDADGFYHTGDGGRFDASGHLFFTGRLGDLIKTGGANVTPREVEVVLEGRDDVKEAYVVGLPDADRGQVVAAAVVPHAGRSLDPEVLRGFLRGELSAYKVPKHFFVTSHDELPFTDSGKIDKRRLGEQLAGLGETGEARG